MIACRGQYSIQQEINNIASGNGKNWTKNICDPLWREAVRQKLLERSNEWCDYKSDLCCCEPWYRPNFSRVKVLNLFN